MVTTRTLPVLLQGGAYDRQSLELTVDLEQHQYVVWPPEQIHLEGHGERSPCGAYVFRMHYRDRLDMTRRGPW